MSDIKIVNEQGEESKVEAPEQKGESFQSEDLFVHSVAEMFDLKPSEISQYRSKINTLIDYAKSKTDQHSPEGIKWAIRSLGLKLGTPPLGEKMITYVTTYAHLALDRDRLSKEIDKYERN